MRQEPPTTQRSLSPDVFAMTGMTHYRQCTLRKRVSPFVHRATVTYIPDEFAKLGHSVRLREKDQSWDDGWVVQHVGVKLACDELPDSHRAIEHHYLATSDAQPRRA